MHMKVEVFHKLLDRVCAQLTLEAKTVGFSKALIFENRVREVTQQIANELDADPAAQMGTGFPEEFPLSLLVDMNPPAQGFPDIVLGNASITNSPSRVSMDDMACCLTYMMKNDPMEGPLENQLQKTMASTY